MTKTQKKAPSKQPKGLGKGLSALMNESYSKSMDIPTKPETTTSSETNENRQEVQSLPVESIHSGKFQPRTHFKQSLLRELADSIRENGIMQPIVARPSADKKGKYEIIAGERRWRAAKLANLNYVPVIVRSIENKQALELALVENIQRQDLSAIEEARGFKRLIEEFNYTQEALAEAVGKSRSHVANLLRLLSLPASVQDLVERFVLSMGHARALLNADEPAKLAKRIANEGLSVRQTERLVKGEDIYNLDSSSDKKDSGRKPTAPKALGNKDADVIALEATLSANLGMNVSINDRGNKGEIILRYESLIQLDQILQRLGGAGV